MVFPLPLRYLLWPFSWVYGVIAQVRALLYAKGILEIKRLNAPVISVGNLTVGGTGKTPMVIWLAEKFMAEGNRVAILSRGYRGSNGTSDEIELMKRRLGERVTFGVGANRYEEGRKIEQKQPVDVFLLDDGFQHRKLSRNIDILMLDGSRKLKNEWLLPAGALREPVSACIRADLIIITRKFEQPDILARDSHEHQIFYAETRLLGFRKLGTEQTPVYVNELGPGPFFAFCAIGNPAAFCGDLQRWHVPVAGKLYFRDHHRYSMTDVQKIEASAELAGAQALLTTEKDEQNLRGMSFRMPVYVSVIDFVLSSESELLAALARLLRESRGARA
jgi:tetraacyldisaccharide 4'-kinase